MIDGVAQVLKDEAEEESVLCLPTEEAIRVLQVEEWRDSSRVQELSSIEFRTLVLRGALVLLAIIGVIATLIICWRRSRLSRPQMPSTPA